MRLLSLTLEKYGAFSDRRLEFRDGAAAHIVFGPNEAGKSTALSAVGDLLFGFPERTPLDFRHKASDLRVAGEVLSRDGARLSFARRKGRLRTLLAPGGGDLPDDALAPFLGGLTREVFSRAFGLNAEALRRHADEMLKARGGGDDGLLAAAAGLQGLRGARRALEDEAKDVFTSHKSGKPLFYKALDRHAEARQLARERELRSGDWRKLEERISEGETRLAEIKDRRGALSATLRKIERLQRLKPSLKEIDDAAAALAAIGESGDLPRGFGGALRAAMDAVAEAEKRRDEAAEKHGKSIDELASIGVDAALIARGGEVTAHFSGLGSYADQSVQRPKIAREAADYRERALDLSARLGLADIDDLKARRPTDAGLAEARALLREGEAIERDDEALRDSAAKEAGELARLDDDIAGLGALVDPAPLREKFAALGDIAGRVQEREREAAPLAADARTLREDAARLSPPIADLDAMARAALPAPETVARFRREFDDIDIAARAGEGALAGAKKDAARAAAALAKIEAGRPVPTPERIEAARGHRAALWSRLRAALLGGEPLPGAALVEAAADFEAATAEADRLADDAARDAGRVSEHRARAEEFSSFNEKIDELNAAVAERDARRDDMRARWRETWAPAGIAPTAPAEMSLWLGALPALLERRNKIAARRAAVEALDRDLARLDAPLAALARETGLPAMPGLDAGRAAASLRDRLKTLEQRWASARDAQTLRAAARKRRDALAPKRDAIAERRAAWEEKWRGAMAALGLRPNAPRDAAAAAIEAWGHAPELTRAHENRRGRVEGMTRDMEAFEEKTAALATELAPDLADFPPGEATSQLQKRLGLARDADTRRKEVARRVAERAGEAKAADAAFDAARDKLTSLAARAPDNANLAELRDRADARDKAIDALVRARENFNLVADGADEAAARADIEGFDAGRAADDVAELQRDIAALHEDENRAYADRVAAVAERDARGNAEGAEFAAQQKLGAEAEMRGLARRWVTLKLAGLMLDAALEKHRAERADPWLARAGAHFATLTGGGFSAIEQRFSDNDAEYHVALRANGEPVEFSGLSEATRDQLYLALRLAYIEDYASRAEPAPFVADDIFASFDDARASFALKTLGDLSVLAQPIVFTHHRHVVDIARRVLGDGADVVELG